MDRRSRIKIELMTNRWDHAQINENTDVEKKRTAGNLSPKESKRETKIGLPYHLLFDQEDRHFHFSD